MSLNMRGLNQLISRWDETLVEADHDAADAGVEVVRDEVPVLSGDLQGTTRSEPADGGGWRVVSGNDEIDYAGDVNFGTPHQDANPYMDRAAERLKGDMPKIYTDALKELVRSATQ